MVKSGLDKKNFEDNSVPRVSHYRLAAHLILAMSLYSTMFYMSLVSKCIVSSLTSIHSESIQAFFIQEYGSFTLKVESGISVYYGT
jgi:heme A synthase